MNINKAIVLGAGTMGAGIAHLMAQKGINTIMYGRNEGRVTKARDNIEKRLKGRVEKGKMTEDEVKAIMSRLIITTNMEDAADCDFVVEALLEDVKLKQEVFAKLDAIVKDDVILASTTTACSLTEIASSMKKPERFAGMHFYNPAVVMKLVEIMPALQTSPETIEKVVKISEFLGKEAVVTAKEGIAGITSRILAGLLNEAVWVLDEGIGTAADIDKAMKMGANHAMGPLELIDLIGLDIHLAKTETQYSKIGDARYRPCYLLKKMVAAGYLGRKVGKGFYDYSQNPPVPTRL
jgi:3-hydroxybutyryl-CoA dehydrogenase